MTDEPLMHHPAVRALELEAIRLYRAEYPYGLAWQARAQIKEQP
jgi:hypothetical protein